MNKTYTEVKSYEEIVYRVLLPNQSMIGDRFAGLYYEVYIHSDQLVDSELIGKKRYKARFVVEQGVFNKDGFPGRYSEYDKDATKTFSTLVEADRYARKLIQEYKAKHYSNRTILGIAK